MGIKLTVGDYLRAMDEIAPFSTAMDWDNAGLLLGSAGQEVTAALLALDVTSPVLEEAVKLGANLIITHHPVIFRPLRRIGEEDLAYRLIRQGIAVISAHTNLDMAPGGVNDSLAARLGLTGCVPLSVEEKRPYRKLKVYVPVAQADRVYHAMADAGGGALGNYSHAAFLGEGEGRFRPLDGANPAVGAVGMLERVPERSVEMLVPPDRLEAVLTAMRQAHPYETPSYDVYKDYAVEHSLGMGAVGRLPRSMEPGEFVSFVGERLGCRGLRYSSGAGPVRRVAVCGGSGADYLDRAMALGAQALVTAEAKHHQWLQAAEAGFLLVDAGHHHTEAVVLEPLAVRLGRLLPGAAVGLSRAGDDGMRYL